MGSEAQLPVETAVVPGTVLVETPEELRVAPYAGVVWISGTERDYQLTFMQIIPDIKALGSQPEAFKARVVARVVLSPTTANELLNALAAQLGKTVSEEDEH